MIRIATIHPDVVAAERLRLGAPRFNAEWLELFNASGRATDVYRYFVVNAGGEGFTITLPRRKKLVLGPYQSLVIFSGLPDNPADPPACYLANEAMRLFLKRDSYFWDLEEDDAYLYSSRESYVENPDSYLDHYRYKRRSARIIIPRES
ncbi:MAG: hypothetical protein GTN49_04150 [candidate division Zixibacteria bacterium]|nr:hypothetical protein [candidate division Zixibacteria bacterium]